MATILPARQMRNVEQIHVARGGASWPELMERAGRAVVDHMQTWLKHKGRNATGRAHVLCGPGNNGGDGYVIASYLKASGWNVLAWEYDTGSRMAEPGAQMRMQWDGVGTTGNVLAFAPDSLQPGDLVVDALFGIGLNRSLPGPLLEIMHAIPSDCLLVAVDILTGVNADNGMLMGPDQREGRPADLTVTFECAKPGHVLGAGAILTGELQVASIGMQDEVGECLSDDQELARITYGDDLPWKSILAKHPMDHKYTHGHVLVLAGGSVGKTSGGRGGAARLAAGAALRVGAGLVTIGAHRDSIPEHAACLNAIMLTEISGPGQLTEFLSDGRVNTILIGPGYGLGPQTRQTVIELLNLGRNLVLDADALSSFESCPGELFRSMHESVVITPHPGEFRKLFPDLAGSMAPDGDRSRIDCVKQASDRSGATVILKGHDTVIGVPGDPVMVPVSHDRSSSAWLATAGSGDILAGIIAGLMARGAGVSISACMGALLLTDAARIFGPGLTSDDMSLVLASAISRRCQERVQ